MGILKGTIQVDFRPEEGGVGWGGGEFCKVDGCKNSLEGREAIWLIPVKAPEEPPTELPELPRAYRGC